MGNDNWKTENKKLKLKTKNDNATENGEMGINKGKSEIQQRNIANEHMAMENETNYNNKQAHGAPTFTRMECLLRTGAMSSSKFNSSESAAVKAPRAFSDKTVTMLLTKSANTRFTFAFSPSDASKTLCDSVSFTCETSVTSVVRKAVKTPTRLMTGFGSARVLCFAISV